jgi:hypothetical protein
MRPDSIAAEPGAGWRGMSGPARARRPDRWPTEAVGPARPDRRPTRPRDSRGNPPRGRPARAGNSPRRGPPDVYARKRSSAVAAIAMATGRVIERLPDIGPTRNRSVPMITHLPPQVYAQDPASDEGRRTQSTVTGGRDRSWRPRREPDRHDQGDIARGVVRSCANSTRIPCIHGLQWLRFCSYELLRSIHNPQAANYSVICFAVQSFLNIA